MKFGIRVRLKPSNNRGEFELDRAKNNIAENSFALEHETHNTHFIVGTYMPWTKTFICMSIVTPL